MKNSYWILVFIGLLFMAFSILLAMNSAQTFTSLLKIFAFASIGGGLLQISFALMNRRYLQSQFWVNATGVFDLLLGLLLLLPLSSVTETEIQLIIGIWALARTLGCIGFSEHFKINQLKYWSTTTVFGIISTVFSIVFLWNPEAEDLNRMDYASWVFVSLATFYFIAASNQRKISVD